MRKFLLHLLLLLCAYRTGARELTEKSLEEVDVHETVHPSSNTNPFKKVFLTLNDLEVGKKMPFFFELGNPSTSPKFLPKEEADSIPFSLQHLPHILDLFSFPHDSPQAKAMEDTLRKCESPPMQGEIKFCVTSLESLLEFAGRVFGLGTDFQALTNVHPTKPKTGLQNYTILEEPQEFPAPKMMVCHTLSYPYAVFVCHTQAKGNRVFKVPLGGDNGDKVEAITVCHMDTSHWRPDHPAFGTLGVKPGDCPICHSVQSDNLVFVPLSAAK